jgi:dipeptidyl aminopeptidase/acylaminoacyl peptidase
LLTLLSSTYIELNPGTLVVSYTRNATDGLILVAIVSGYIVHLPTDLVQIHHNSVRKITDSKFTIVGSKITSPTALYTFDIKLKKHELLRSTTSIPLSTSIFSQSKSISFPRTYGKDQTGLSHAIFLPPHNPDFSPVPGTKPPLIVYVHGGPTANSTPGLSLDSQYWTSRGYAHVSVNYAGSRGFGREYRESLNSFWGIKDIDDTASCVAYLAAQGLVDGTKVGITGQSSGGYSVLQALCTYPDLFAAGSSLYGISNLETLATGTHKFESHYLFPLMFVKGASEEEQKKILWDRSPCHHADKIKSPLLILQGSIDQVVPLEQALEMEKVMREGGKDITIRVFEGEGHGFKQEKNVKIAREEEEALWRRTLLG